MNFLIVLPWLLSLGLFVMLVRIRKTLRPRLKKAFWKGIKLAYVVPDDAPNVAGELWMRGVSLRYPQGRGSGYLIDNEYVLTAAHVVVGKDEQHRAIQVHQPRGLWKQQKAMVIAVDIPNDLALLRLEKPLGLNLAPSGVSEEDIHPEDDRFSGYAFFMHPRPQTMVWRSVGIHSHHWVGKLMFLNGGPKDGDGISSRPGDSGSIGLDLFGRIITVHSARLEVQGGEAENFMLSAGPPPQAIRTFLQTHWPNFRD